MRPAPQIGHLYQLAPHRHGPCQQAPAPSRESWCGAAGAGIGFLPHYVARQLPGVERVLPALPLPALPCWLAVHREIRPSKPVRRVYDFLAATIPPAVGD